MKALTIKVRLLATLGIAIVLLAAIGITGVIGLGSVKEGLRTVYEDRTMPLDQVTTIQQLLLSNRLFLAVALVTPTAEEIRRNTEAVERNIGDIGQVWETYMATTLTPEERIIAEKFATDRSRFVQEGLRPTIDLLRAGRIEEARTHVADVVRPLYVPVGEGIKALVELQIDVARQEYENANGLYATLRTTAIVSIVAGVAVVLWMAWLLMRAIMNPLQQAVGVARRIAGGELDHDVRIARNDELGELLTALRDMAGKLSQIVGDVRGASDAVSASAREIASGNDDLSQRTQEQASALEETASSMEEMTSTVKQNADNARQANQLAAGARTQAEQGGQVVSMAVSAMNEISASSRKIADIISVIDEQGRGFAVVAAEVRNLAQRSAGAAKEIKDLIQDSVEKVKTGSGLVDESGKTLTEIVDSVKKVTDIVAEIAAASQEQSAGIEQVNKAVTQMDEVTQQNAALVEEAAAASRSMEEQGRKLVDLMRFFRTGSGG